MGARPLVGGVFSFGIATKVLLGAEDPPIARDGGLEKTRAQAKQAQSCDGGPGEEHFEASH
jgi:hypothetical protein